LLLFQLKQEAIGTANQESKQPDESYKRKNDVQIMKVRQFVRNSKYLLDPMTEREHTSIDTKNRMSEDLIKLPSIAIDNTIEYIKAKVKGDSVKLTPVFVTQKDENEHCSLQNKTKDEIKTLIYRLIENLDEETAKLQYEIFTKTVKKEKKEKYIEFFLSLVEVIEEAGNSDDDSNEFNE